MTYTALHRQLGYDSGPLTDELIDEAIAQGIAETDDLDWKSELPPAKGLPQTDFPKDIAAMANSGGGIIVYGVKESQKRATMRCDIGEFSDVYERTLRSAAVTAISPPVFGLGIYPLGGVGNQVVAVVVPASVDGPHLIYRNDLFGAPIRNDADTFWMRERQIEAMYRTRFEERRHAAEALINLYEDVASGRDSGTRAWFIAVAHPRLPGSTGPRLTRDEAHELFQQAGKYALEVADRSGVHPFESVDLRNPRPGLRRWVAPNKATRESERWREAWISVHNDGSVSVAAAIGGHRSRDGGYSPGERINASGVECAIADFMGLIRAVGEHLSKSEYEVQIGIEWTGSEPLIIEGIDRYGFPVDGVSLPLARYNPVTSTIFADAEADRFHHQLRDLALDCVNQGGIANLRIIKIPQ